MKERQLGILTMVIASLGLGIAVLFMKVIPDFTGMPPQHVAIWRFTIATPFLLLILKVRKPSQRLLPERPWLFLLLGLVFSAASFSAIFALQRLSSSIYVILIYIYPSLVVVYALLTGGRVPKLFWFGLPLTLVGLFLTSFEFGTALVIDPIGMLIVLINALVLVVYMVLSAKAFTGMKSPVVGSSAVMIGAFLVGLSAIPILGITTPGTIQGWVYLVLFSVLGTVMPILGMNVSLGLLGAARGSVIITLQPVFTVLMAMIFLNETLTLQQWVGGALVIFAVYLLQRSPDRPGKSEIQSQKSSLIQAGDWLSNE